MPDFEFLRDYTRRGSDSDIEYGTVSVPTSVWTTVVTFTATEDRTITAFGADLLALLSTTYRFRLQVNAAVKWSEVATTTAIAYIPVPMSIVSGDVVEVQVFHSEATATDAGASIAHSSS